MKKFMKSYRRLPAVFLAVMMTFSMFGATAFAAWPSFQNDYTNNGVITGGAPPTSAPATVAVPLVVNNPNGDVFTGVDATSVINNGIAYTVYNGGDAPASEEIAGGARIQATTLSTGSDLWNSELFDPAATNPADIHADNVSQLSTPYYDGTNIWALKTTSTNVGTISIRPTTFPANTTTTATGTVTLSQSVHTLNVQSNLNAGTATNSTYGITLTSGTVTYVLVPAGTGFSGSYGTYYTYNDGEIPAGTYTVNVAVAAGTAAATGNSVSLGRYDWALYTVDPSDGEVSRVTTGEGEANTPISYDSTYVYFGIWGGTRSYYQVAKASGHAVAQFAANDDFYNAGAVVVNDGKNDYAVFGSDSGVVYVLNTAGFSPTPSPITLLGAGQVRSTAVAPASGSGSGYIYLTSKGTGGNDGMLWSILTSSIATSPTINSTPVKYSNSSTSTPVISGNNILYVGTSFYDPSFNGYGTVQAFNPVTFEQVAQIYPVGGGNGDPVQASPIVWSDTDDEIDYIYFTTNSANGKGYAYSYTVGGSAAALWNAGGTSNNPYAVQGFASDGGYLIYGDDGNYLYIMH